VSHLRPEAEGKTHIVIAQVGGITTIMRDYISGYRDFIDLTIKHEGVKSLLRITSENRDEVIEDPSRPGVYLFHQVYGIFLNEDAYPTAHKVRVYAFIHTEAAPKDFPIGELKMWPLPGSKKEQAETNEGEQ